MIEPGHSVLVLGAGRSGRAAAELVRRLGGRVRVYDRDTTALYGFGDDVETSTELPDFAGFDWVVQSPGIPVADAPNLVPEVDLAASVLRGHLIGVTGSNGKSTTTVLIGEMLRESGKRVAVGGNLGTALCALADAGADFVVAELSSFQLERARRLHADTAVLLNLAPDHLDRHGSLDAYGAAKARLAELQSGPATLVANLDDAWARGVAERSRVSGFPFSEQRRLSDGAFLDADSLCVARAGERVFALAVAELSAAARTPVANALAAAAAAFAAGASAQGIERALRRFEGLPHRAREIAVRHGVRFVDDSKATNPAAAAASLGAQHGPVIWLAGGRNKGLDFAPLAEPAARARAIVLYGECAAELEAALGLPVERAATLEDAVLRAAELAHPGDTVLLAPAAASFDAFTSFEHRGRAFAECVATLPGGAVC